MPNGRTRVIASPTFSGVSPPASRIRRCAAIAAAADQSTVRPVPPRFSGSYTSTSSRVRDGQIDSCGSATVTALIAGVAMPAASATVSSPCSCTAPRGTRAATWATCSAGWLTKTPTAVTNGGRVATIARARYGSMHRGLPGQNTNPRAPAPHSTAAAASSARVMPQIFTNTKGPILGTQQSTPTQNSSRFHHCDLRALCVLCDLCALCAGRGSEQRLELLAWLRGRHEPFADQKRAIAKTAQPQEIRGRPQPALADPDDFGRHLRDQFL